MVVTDFDHELGPQRLPITRARGRPAARPSRPVPGEARRLDQLLQLRGQRFLLVARYGRGEADVMQKPAAVVETEQQRADHRLAFVVAKAANYAVGTAVTL